ncbi:uncharacterized protein J7T54_001859, partial [Emericellopsis cladophorae]
MQKQGPKCSFELCKIPLMVEGMVRFATGGRFGEVYKVTNLADSGAGSLRDVVSQPKRIVVFDVGGVINMKSRVVVSKMVHIDGQTAPSDSWRASGKDAITIAEGARMIFDHVSVSWGRDETLSISGTAANVTVQGTLIAQGLEMHSCGGLMGTDGGISPFRNLCVDNNTRNPKVKGANDLKNN